MNEHLHSLVAQLSPSAEQTPPIQARDSDVVVTAGAGAGKTRTLVARYLALLADGLPLREIVAITFTKKAAREMRNRVRQEIRRYLERGELSPDERAHWRATYTQLDAARIGTIHSLCAEILRHHPAEVGIDPRFELLDEGQMALLQAQAVDAALGWATDQPAIVPLFDAFAERTLRRILDDLLTQRLDVADARAQVGDALWARWQSYLVAPLRAFVDDPAVQASFADLTALRANGTLARAAEAGDKLVPDLRGALEQWDAIRAAQQTADWVTVSRHLAPLRDHLKQKGRKANWAPARPKPIIKELQTRYDETVKPLVKSGIDLALDRRLAQELVPALLRLYEYALEDYVQAKRTQQALDFDDLEAQALSLLQTHADVRAYWQEQLQALLVDEFQDTNGRQRDLLHALNGDAGRLFIVGDAKQSIYRFRGADVTVFRAERATIDTEGVGFALATSYRAHRDLVRSLNALLRPVLGEADPERPYVEPFAPLRHHREAPAAGLTPPYVELQLAVGSKSDGALERAAQVLAARLATLVEAGDVRLPVEQPADGQEATRLLDYGDVAILCRASTSFAAYENALEEAGIPFLTVAGRGFYDRPEVRDLLNALQALADPTDDLALVGLLRSPVMGLSDMALYRLRRAQQDADAASLWAMLADADLAFLEADLGAEAERALEARDLIRRLHGQVGRTAVADVLKAFLDATGYRAALLRAGEERAAHNVAKLLVDAHASEIVGVGTFVAYVAELRDVAPREGEARSIATGAVQIMTVHQAKGLEFPVVVLGDAARTDPRPRGVLIDARLGVVPPLTEEQLVGAADGAPEVEKVTAAAYRLALEQERDEEAAESDRLLYVAATRARELLWINGTVRVYKSGGLGAYGWLDRLDAALHLSDHAPACAADGDAVHRFTLDLDGQSVDCAIYEPEAALPPAAVEQAAQPAAPPPGDRALLAPVDAAARQVDADVRAAERDPPRRVWRVVPERPQGRAPAWVVGALVHEALAAWRFPADAKEDFAAWARAQARSYGLTDQQQLTDAVRRSRGLLTRFWQHPLYSEMDDADQRLHEVPYSRTTAEGRESGSIDALFRNGERWTLVEFKTDHVASQANLEALLTEKDYVAQVRRYAEAVTELLGERPTCYLCFLNARGKVRLQLID
jgi:ATP-dependent helicase/nuclease subunit A